VAWVGSFCGGLGDVIAGVSVIAKAKPTPQGQKDGLLEFTDTAQRAFANTAQKLAQLGPPRITDGKQVQDTAVGFFTTAAGTVGGQRAKLAALDANDPDFVQKASHLAGPDLSAASVQMQGLTSNKELMPAFRAAPERQRADWPAWRHAGCWLFSSGCATLTAPRGCRVVHTGARGRGIRSRTPR
jgi:hypothetical protein